jgi:hypothetical protein
LEPSSAAHPSHHTNPPAGFTAVYVNDRAGRSNGRITLDRIDTITKGRLSDLPDGTFVIVYGSIETVRTYRQRSRTWGSPLALFLLNSGTGASTVVHVDHNAYARIAGYLTPGAEVGVSGTVVRPEAGAPEYIALARVLVSAQQTPQTAVNR